MKKQFHFTPGPSELYPSVASHIQTALKSGVCSISHRSSAFKEIYAHTTRMMKQLIGVPEDYTLLYFSSSNEIWERILQDCVSRGSVHYVNGAFSKKFFSFGMELGKNPLEIKKDYGIGFTESDIRTYKQLEMVSITQNESSTGVYTNTDFTKAVKTLNPNVVTAVDAVSSFPYAENHFPETDILYFSVQKCMGLPAGLAVAAVSPHAFQVAQSLEEANKYNTSPYHSLLKMKVMADQHQTAETPNVLGIYLLGKVAEDMLTKGLSQIRLETNQKAAILYQWIKDHPDMEAFVDVKEHASSTVIVAKSKRVEEQVKALLEKGIIVGKGYGKFKDQHLRIANFPAHSKELVYQIVDTLTPVRVI
ncbi:MAG: aminotransferase class V-fold PLP-dependent enzyme [Cyclobacteriaceae bacterium]|nr:aminotransferase class V-fold PLP-dependent enzyme [Cyclobacteriaceae bacterium]MCH8516090.1 aminotransferase class V-fold PLP-dependent enzyme [Cyclobacteriaceae bacterium]